MKSVFKVLYAKAMMFSYGFLFLLAIVPFRTLEGVLEKGEVREVQVTSETMGGLTQYARLYTLGLGISLFVKNNFTITDPRDLAFIKKYEFPLMLPCIPLADSAARFFINGLKYMYYQEGDLFRVYHFLWIPILAILYFVHKYLERAYEDFRLDED